jgi:starvation-inducible DNA-binding protein
VALPLFQVKANRRVIAKTRVICHLQPMKTSFNTANDLPADTRKTAAAILNQTLANLTDLYSQTKQAHWNVRGKYFFQLHKLFDELAGTVEEHIDPTAERITALAAVANGTIRQAAAASALKEFPTADAEDLGFVIALIERYAQCAAAARKGIADTAAAGDADSADLLTAVSRDLDKSLWFLEAHTRK